MIIAFVPVRCGSKSIPYKNIKELCGKPLVYWVLKSLENSRNIDIIYVATDCEKIRSVVNQFGFTKVKVYERDEENARDSSSTEDVMLEFIQKNSFDEQDLFLLVQATSPLTETRDFDNALRIYKDSGSSSLLTCVRQKSFLWSRDGIPMNYDYRNRPRRQDFEGFLVENGAFYINTIGNIVKYQNRLSDKITIYEMDDYKSVDIDEEADWLIAEKLMHKYILKDSDNS